LKKWKRLFDSPKFWGLAEPHWLRPGRQPSHFLPSPRCPLRLRFLLLVLLLLLFPSPGLVAQTVVRSKEGDAPTDKVLPKPTKQVSPNPPRKVPPKPPKPAPSRAMPETMLPMPVPTPSRLPHEVEIHRDQGTGIELCRVTAGQFIMGSPASEAGRYEDEGPQHLVILSRDFWMGKTEVTQRLFKAIMGYNPSQHRAEDHPVEMVSWDEARAFLQRLNDRGGALVYRLPTEAEWEYACRGVAAGSPAGSLETLGWFGTNAGGSSHAVGLKQANAWGLQDLHGNVWEWCEDRFGAYAQGPQVDPAGATTGTERVLRGGAWNSPALDCRSAYRRKSSPDTRSGFIGFRVVATKQPR
jgi:formylglycine-generating enzyme required for sulfatase activity